MYILYAITGVNPADDAEDTPQYFGWGRQQEYPQYYYILQI